VIPMLTEIRYFLAGIYEVDFLVVDLRFFICRSTRLRLRVVMSTCHAGRNALTHFNAPNTEFPGMRQLTVVRHASAFHALSSYN
jgi:hypothetical protein